MHCAFNFNPNFKHPIILDIKYGKYTLNSSNPTRGSKSISGRILMRRRDQWKHQRTFQTETRFYHWGHRMRWELWCVWTKLAFHGRRGCHSRERKGYMMESAFCSSPSCMLLSNTRTAAESMTRTTKLLKPALTTCSTCFKLRLIMFWD